MNARKSLRLMVGRNLDDKNWVEFDKVTHVRCVQWIRRTGAGPADYAQLGKVYTVLQTPVEDEQYVQLEGVALIAFRRQFVVVGVNGYSLLAHLTKRQLEKKPVTDDHALMYLQYSAGQVY